MITFPKRGNEKTHQQNGVDTSNNTTKTKYLLSKFRDYGRDEFLRDRFWTIAWPLLASEFIEKQEVL